jgi:hypothetical protein
MHCHRQKRQKVPCSSVVAKESSPHADASGNLGLMEQHTGQIGWYPQTVTTLVTRQVSCPQASSEIGISRSIDERR